MKRFLVLAVLLVPVVAQPKPAAAPAKTTDKAPSKKTVTPSNMEIPAGAIEVGSNIYSYTDKAGKKWMYYRTPLGISKAMENSSSETNAAKERSDAASPETQVTEQGDSLKFVRPGPFGNYTWVKKKADLDDIEKEAYEASRKKTPQAKTSMDPKPELKKGQ